MKLNNFIKKDPRIMKIYDYAEKEYCYADLPQHNWEHVLRDLYRALIIAETEKNVDYTILIPAVLLHDVGVTEGEDYQKHEEIGSLTVKRDLPEFGYTKDEIEKVVHCIESHSGKIKPSTTEAKVLFDADKLEKSGIGGIFTFYRAQQELYIPIDEMIKKATSRNQKFIEEGFYTKKAKEICGNGFQECLKHFNEVMESLKKRKDFLVSEKDLWEISLQEEELR